MRALVGLGLVVEGPACSRLAGNRIGDAGVEALARALPPSLTALYLGCTCGVGCLLPLSVGACAAVQGRNVVRGAGCGRCGGGSRWEGGQVARIGGFEGSWLRVRLARGLQ